MKNYIGFRADRTLGRKNGGVITYIKATKAVDAEQLIAKSNLYVEYQLIHMKKRNIVIINVYRPPDCQTEKFSSPLYPEWPHRQCVGLGFCRSHVRGSLSAVSLVICSPARIAVCNTWSSGGTALFRVGVLPVN